MDDLTVVLYWSASQSVSYHNGATGEIKGTETQKGAAGSEPIPLGLSRVHVQTFPSFQPTQKQPPEGLAVATPLISPILLPHHLPTVPEKSCVFVLVRIHPFR